MKLFRKAILVIHGFAGGVYDEEYLTHRLELISNYDVYTFTLPGHDGDFKHKTDDLLSGVLDNGYKIRISEYARKFDDCSEKKRRVIYDVVDVMLKGI